VDGTAVPDLILPRWLRGCERARVLCRRASRIRDVRESGDHDQLGPIAVLAELIDHEVGYRIGEQLPGILQLEPQARNCGKAIVGSAQTRHAVQALCARVDDWRLLDRL